MVILMRWIVRSLGIARQSKKQGMCLTRKCECRSILCRNRLVAWMSSSTPSNMDKRYGQSLSTVRYSSIRCIDIKLISVSWVHGSFKPWGAERSSTRNSLGAISNTSHIVSGGMLVSLSDCSEERAPLHATGDWHSPKIVQHKNAASDSRSARRQVKWRRKFRP